MAKQYFSLFTTYGSQVLANAIAKNQPLRITQMAVGDGNGKTVTPTANQTKLVKEVHRANISAISVDPRNNKQVIFEITLPENVGGFYVREMGIFDSSNKLVAVANCPESFKPTLESGSGKVQVLRMILQVSSSDAITLTVDDSVIFVTRGQLAPKTITASSTNGFDNTGHSHQIDQASTTQKGIVQLDDTPNSSATNKAATPNSVKNTIAKNTQFVKIHLSGTKSINADLTKREEIKSVLLGDNFNSDNFVHYQVTTPNGRIHNIANLPISDKSPVMLDFVIVGPYSLFKAHYVSLNRSFFCNVNWGNETLTLDWVEEINGTKRSDSVTSDSSDTVATSKAVKSANDNANGRVSKSGDTINGTFAIKSDYWRKFRLISKDASSWWVETPPNAAESRRMTFSHITPATDTTAEIVKNIYFPAITQNETVAYQTWVKEQAEQYVKKALPIGAVVSFPAAITNPVGFLKCNGTRFNQSTFPDLYRALGNSNQLPNLTRSDVGSVAWFAMNAIPDGWIAFDEISAKVSAEKFPELYRALIAQYGSLANVPKVEDRFIRNAGNGLTLGQVQEDEIKTHVINVPDASNVGNTDGLFHYGERGNTHNQGYNHLTYQGGDETRPKSLVLKLCIKALNCFDDVVFWIKAYGEIVNVGALDAGALAQGLQNKSDVGHTHTTTDITDFTAKTTALIRNVTRKDYSKTITGNNANWDSGNKKSFEVTGQTIVYPDGKIEQFFHFKSFRILWFDQEDAVGTYGRGQEIPIQLWTAMPNKIVNVNAQLVRSVANNITNSSEAAEWTTPQWAIYKQNSLKDKCYLNTIRRTGGSDEALDMLVKVEGY